MNTGLERAIKAAGSAANLARKLKITPAAITQWRGVPPLARCPEIQKVTGVSLRSLRPDFFKRSR